MNVLLTDTDAIGRISQKLKQEDKSLWGKIKDFLHGLVEKLKAAYKSMKPDSGIAQTTRETIRRSEAILEAYTDAAAEAVMNYNLQDGQKNNAQEGVQYSDRASKYSYDYFEGKAEAQIVDINSDVGTDRKEIRSSGIKSALQVGERNEYGSVSVYVDDLGESVVVGKDGIGHSLRRENRGMPSENYIVAANAGPILKNGILINELTPKKDNAASSYVLISVARDQHGTGYVVESIVNKFSHELESMDVLYSMNAKKELAALNAPGATLKTLPVTSSSPTIPSVLQLVNDHFSDILPEEVLKHYGHTERPSGKIGESALYSSRTATDSRYMELARNPEGNREQLSRLVEEAAREAGYDSPLLYHGTQSFGFTQFDLSKMDDGRSIFLTSNPDIAATYSGVNGKRDISGTGNTDVSKLSMQEVVQMLNRFPPESGSDYSCTWLCE